MEREIGITTHTPSNGVGWAHAIPIHYLLALFGGLLIIQEGVLHIV